MRTQAVLKRIRLPVQFFVSCVPALALLLAANLWSLWLACGIVRQWQRGLLALLPFLLVSSAAQTRRTREAAGDR